MLPTLSHHTIVDKHLSKEADLIITSPPAPMRAQDDMYFTGVNSRITGLLKSNKSTKAFESMHKVLDEYWSDAYSLLRPGGFLCIIANRSHRLIDKRHIYFDNASRISFACQKKGFDALPGIMWKKPSKTPPHYMGSGMLPAGAYVSPQYHHILIFRKGKPREFNQEEKDRRAASALFCEERNEWYLDLWPSIQQSEIDTYLNKEMSSQESVPIELYERLIMMHSIAGDMIYDPFAANTKTLLSSIITGRSSTTCDDLRSGLSLISKRRLKTLLKSRIQQRIVDHISYARTKDGMIMRYKNEPLGIPVQTQQEKQIQSLNIQSIRMDKNQCAVTYRKWKKAELQLILQN